MKTYDIHEELTVLIWAAVIGVILVRMIYLEISRERRNWRCALGWHQWGPWRRSTIMFGEQRSECRRCGLREKRNWGI